jgi:hypothetical protein
MKTETKLWLRKKTLMALRALLWHADEWLHAREVRLRDELSVPVPLEPPRTAGSQKPTVSCPYPFPADELLRHRIRGRLPRGGEPQRAAKKKGCTAAAFDLRFGR